MKPKETPNDADQHSRRCYAFAASVYFAGWILLYLVPWDALSGNADLFGGIVYFSSVLPMIPGMILLYAMIVHFTRRFR